MGLRRVAVRGGQWMAAIGGLCALLLSVTAAPAAAAPTWHQQGPGNVGSLQGVSFSDAAHGWAVGLVGSILATGDGGETWTKQIDPDPGNNNLFGVDFVDDQHGWAVGREGVILATSDGGARWIAQPSGMSEELIGVDFVDAENGWVVGSRGVILATEDGGADWAVQQPAGESTGPLTDVSFANANDGWAVGFSPPRIMATTDGGENWTLQSAVVQAQGVDAVDSRHAWVVGAFGTIATTSNGGEQWTEQVSGVTAPLAEISFADALHGWAVGEGGTVLSTGDGGTTWTKEDIGVAVGLNGVDFPDATHGTVVGDGPTVASYYEPGPAAELELSAPSTITAGAPLSFAVTARDSIGHVATGYAGEVEFSSDDPQAVLPANSTLTGGSGQFSAVLKTAQTSAIVASDGPLSGATGPIAVSPGPASRLEMTGLPTAATAGEPFSFGVTAFDPYGNIATGYTGPVSFTSTDAAASLPTATTLTAGEGAFSATLRTAGDEEITVGDGTLLQTSPAIPVAPGPTAELTLTTPPTATAGEPFEFEVESFDAFGNPTPGYSGTLHFTSSDPGAILPADATISGGSGSFGATLVGGGDQTITAGDIAESAIVTTSDPIAVGKVTPTLAVLASGGVTLGGAIHATAKLDGVDPTGSLQFALYGPDDATCTGAPVDTASVPVNGAGAYDSPPFTPTVAGTYRWVVAYPGDGANLGAASACADPAAAVTVAAPPAKEEPKQEDHAQPQPPAAPTPQVSLHYTPNHAHAPNRKGPPRYTFVFGDEAPGVTFYCRLDGKPWKACSSPTVYRELRRGRHVFRVKSVDPAGVESAVQTVKFSAGRRR